MSNHQMILWFDNWYWERFSSDPGNPVRSLNISAIAVLHIPDIPPFPGHRAYEEISLGLDSLISELHKEVKMMINRCVGIIAEPIDDTWVRVPFEFQRQKCVLCNGFLLVGILVVFTLRYLLLLLCLSEFTTSGQLDLISLLKDLMPLQRHTKKVAEVILDL